MNGLKLEPGWRQAWVTRLNLFRLKSKPPTIARIAPSPVSADTNAACTSGTCVTSQPFGPSATRMTMPGLIRRATGAFSDSQGATSFSPSPVISTDWPRLRATRIAFASTEVTTAGRKSSISPASSRASSIFSSRRCGSAGSSTCASGPRKP